MIWGVSGVNEGGGDKQKSITTVLSPSIWGRQSEQEEYRQTDEGAELREGLDRGDGHDFVEGEITTSFPFLPHWQLVSLRWTR